MGKRKGSPFQPFSRKTQDHQHPAGPCYGRNQPMCRRQRHQRCKQQKDHVVIIPKRLAVYLTAEQNRMFLIQQCIEQAFLLLLQADAPESRADRMGDPGRRYIDNRYLLLKQFEFQVAVLTPGHGERFIKPADGAQGNRGAGAISRDKFGPLQPRRLLFIVRRPLRTRRRERSPESQQLPEDPAHPILPFITFIGRPISPDPLFRWNSLFILKHHHLPPAFFPARIPHSGRALFHRQQEQLENRPPSFRNFHHKHRIRVGPVSDDNNFKPGKRKVLFPQALQTPEKIVRPFEGWYNYRYIYCHCFSNRNELMTSASKGDVQKHSIASLGVHTIGSLLVLKEVFTSTGTPVSFLNSCKRSY